MQISRPSPRICQSCTSELFFLFKNGFSSTAKFYIWETANHLKIRSASFNGPSWSSFRLKKNGTARPERLAVRFSSRLQTRHFTVGRSAQIENGRTDTSQAIDSKSYTQMEATARRARQTFAENLPLDFLTPDEYKIYERLYGPPTGETRSEDISLLQDFNEGGEENSVEDEMPKNSLWVEDNQGNLKEVSYDEKALEEVTHEWTDNERPIFGRMENTKYSTGLWDTAAEERDYSAEAAAEKGEIEPITASDEVEAMGGDESLEMEEVLVDPNEADFKARLTLYKDMARAKRAAELLNPKIQELHTIEEDTMIDEGEVGPDEEQEYDEDFEGLESADDLYENGDTVRSHPFTSAGRFSTSPTTLQIPKKTVVDPITSLLADASNKHLKEVAEKVFGGPHLPNSTATPSSVPHLQQQPIALEAANFRMGEMEANAYLTANIPGIYAVAMSALVEVRKRVGPGWVRGLLEKEGGPLILDAGGGGAGVLAWQEILRTESMLLHPDGEPDAPSVVLGKSTVVIGSPALRHRASRLLENTTFLPRLPDYNPSLNHPSQENPTASPRKRYDIIIAPHMLWTLKQDYLRKNQVQNLWSLLNPNGGILIIIEKGVPRGFELVAGARETLLKHHIASSESLTAENRIEEPFEGRHRDKEPGMILAPCTNHFKCPLYLTPGPTKGRKDFCRFSQRFTRPHFLQRVLGAKQRNHEDIRFSYVAVQRGVDQRQSLGILQGPAATAAAFEGYEETGQIDGENSKEITQEPEPMVSNFHPLSLPRALMPPLKRRGHVVLDFCTPSGQLERWTVPKSFGKQAYRDARKSRWGDLWALGAKTRVPRNARLGVKSQEPKGKRSRQLDRDEEEDEEEDQGLRQVPGEKNKFGRRTRNKRKPKRPLKLTENSF